jgi:GT2 family glycosyltransferase
MESQSYRDFEVIVIDSSPDDDCGQIVVKQYPWVHYEHVTHRMLPHEARNYGAQKANADLLIFSDPDVYADPQWLSILLDSHQSYGGVIVGSVLYYGRKWHDIGAHLAKFDLFLPGGKVRPIEIAPTLNLLCPRAIFDELGGFSGEYMIGDTIFSWELQALGYPITFVPGALVRHHHTTTWLELVRERSERGREFGVLRAEQFAWGTPRILYQILITLLPLRLANLLLRSFRNSRSAGMLQQFILTFPINLSGHAAWLLGEMRGMFDALRN